MAEQVRRFLRIKEVKQLVGYKRSAIYAKIQALEFPKPYSLSENGRAVAWNSEEIEAWIQTRIDASRKRQALAP